MPSLEKKLLLHCCCAPCTLLPLETLLREGWDLSLYFYNPNIQPAEEYRLRLETLHSLLDSQFDGISLYTGLYEPALWEERVGVFGGPYPLITDSSDYPDLLEKRKLRCAACYRLRFEALATFGAELGDGKGSYCLDTTLTISPYQFIPEAREALTKSAAAQSLEAHMTDWREYYQLSIGRYRELGLYRQNSCGCRYSRQEAELERHAIRRTRSKARTS